MNHVHEVEATGPYWDLTLTCRVCGYTMTPEERDQFLENQRD